MPANTRCLTLAVLLISSIPAFSQTMKTADNSQNAGRVEWLPRQVEAGVIPHGQPFTAEFTVKNICSEDLMIMTVHSGCHCTVAEYSREPVPPGKSQVLKVVFDALSEGPFYKVVTVTTNFDPNQPVPLAISGKVNKPKGN